MRDSHNMTVVDISYTNCMQIRPEIPKTKEHFHLHPAVRYGITALIFLELSTGQWHYIGDLPKSVSQKSV
jgi:hypothetical protein